MQCLSSYRSLHNLKDEGGANAIFPNVRNFLPLDIISCELKQAVFHFRMQHFMEYWLQQPTIPLPRSFVRPFFRLLKRITLENSSDSYIEKYQLKLFISFLFQHLERFYADDGLALSLMLILFHLGSHRYIPMIIDDQFSTTYACPPNLVSPRVKGKDHILEVLQNLHSFNEPSYFLGHLRTFLLDPERSGEYVIGPETYAKAALGCFKKIRSLGHPEAHVWHDMLPELGEDDYFGTWRFDSGHWMVNIFNPPSSRFHWFDLYFIVLGYLIFFLPRSGRLDALIAECLRSKSSFPVPSYWDVDRFPIRRWHLYREIEAYLARFNSAHQQSSRFGFRRRFRGVFRRSPVVESLRET
ncbi:hypothetical protein CPC08DRAFT_824318 [Agrocybe pediades]|nr:hypothetical protein CPC08DRAFT_824318 [Agrocybe pediades]